jgi:hypothetical protein
MFDNLYMIYAKYVSIEKNVAGYGYWYEIVKDGISYKEQFSKRDELLRWIKSKIDGTSIISTCDFNEYTLWGYSSSSISVASDGKDEPLRLIRRKVKTFEDLPSTLSKDRYKWFYWEQDDGEKFYTIFGWDDLRGGWEVREITRQEPKLDPNGTKEAVGTVPPVKPKTYDFYPCAYVEIMEGKGDDFGGYYVEWNDGDWWESVKPNSYRRLNETTMPMKLYKKDNNRFALSYDTFRFKNASVENPPFVGDYIQDVVYFKRRLGYVTSSSVTFSAIIDDDQLNFFADTARAVQPHHPLAYGIDSSKVADIKQIESVHNGLYLIASDGIYSNIFRDELSISPSISKVSNMDISHAVVSDNLIYFINKGRLYVLADNRVTYIGQAFEGLIDDTIDMVVYQPRGYIFFLQADNKTIMAYRWLDLGDERVIGFLSKWTFANKVYSIEVANDKLILVKDVGIFAIDLLNRDTVVADTDANFDSKYVLSDNILSNKWYKYFMKRLELFKSGRVLTSLYRDNGLIEETEEDEVNVLNGTNLDTKVEFKSIDNNPFEIEFVMMTLQVENGNLKRI